MKTDTFKNPYEAAAVVDNFMDLLNLPREIEVYECADVGAKCGPGTNASATMHNNQRAIIYNSQWIGGLPKDTLNIPAMTVMAHEVGHHLSGHTLFLLESRFAEARSNCTTNDLMYDRTTPDCDSLLLSEYKLFRSKLREDELEADRFSGFIMAIYGANLSEVLNTYSQSPEYDDVVSTHPTPSKRREAITSGYNKGLAVTRESSTYSLQEIKSPNIELPLLHQGIVQRNKMLDKVRTAMTWKPIEYLRAKSNIDISSGGKGIEQVISLDQLIKYHGIAEHPFKIDSDSIYFDVFCQYVFHQYNDAIDFAPALAIEVTNDQLRLLHFSNDSVHVVYHSKFEASEISLPEIESLFLEIYAEGFDEAIYKNSNIKRE